VDARSGHAFVANSGDGTVSVLDARTGSVVRTVAVDLHPSALAVDARSGHVFVANEYDGSISMVDARSGRVLRTMAVDLKAWSRPWLPAWGQQWLARLARPSHPSRVVAGSVSVLDVAQ